MELNKLARDLPEVQKRNMDLLTKVGRMLEEEERSDSFPRWSEVEQDGLSHSHHQLQD